MWLGHYFQGQKIKGQGHQAALLTAALTREAGAAVTENVLGVGNYWYVASARRRARRRNAHEGRRGAEAYRVATSTAC